MGLCYQLNIKNCHKPWGFLLKIDFGLVKAQHTTPIWRSKLCGNKGQKEKRSISNISVPRLVHVLRETYWTTCIKEEEAILVPQEDGRYF